MTVVTFYFDLKRVTMNWSDLFKKTPEHPFYLIRQIKDLAKNNVLRRMASVITSGGTVSSKQIQFQ